MMKTIHYLMALLILLISSAIVAVAPLEDERQAFAYIVSTETKAGAVNSSHVTLLFDVNYRKSRSIDNLNLSVKFFDASTNLLLYEFSKEISSGEEYGAETVTCTVKKTHDYRVRIALEKDGRIYSTREMNIFKLSQIPPDEERLEIIVKGADFTVLNKSDSRVMLRATYYVESPETVEGVRFRIKAIQLESNLLVDDFWAEKTVEAGRTNLLQFDMTLIDRYNYRVVLEIWSRNYVTGTREDVVKFNPEGYKEGEVKKETFRVEDFVRKEMQETPVPEYRPEYLPKPTPGFEAVLLIISGGAALWIARRR